MEVWPRYILIIFSGLFWVSGLVHAKGLSSHTCRTINEIVDQLPLLPEQLFFKHPDLRIFLTPRIGITPFSWRGLKELESLLIQEGRWVAHPIAGRTGDPMSDPYQSRLFWSYDKELDVAGSNVLLRGHFVLERDLLSREEFEQYRAALTSVGSEYALPIPNRDELIAYWQQQERGHPRLVGLHMLSTDMRNPAARIIEFPTGLANLYLPSHKSEQFVSEPWEYRELGVTPDYATSIEIKTEGPLFPTRQFSILFRDGGRLQVPVPHAKGAAPVRKFLLEHARLRPVTIHEEGRVNRILFVPRAKFSVHFDQSFEHPNVRRLKGDDLGVLLESDGQTPSAFGLPHRESYIVRYYDAGPRPRELFRVVFKSKAFDSEDSPKNEPVYTPRLLSLFDEFLDTPAEILDAYGRLHVHDLSQHIGIGGKVPIDDTTQLSFYMALDTRRRVYIFAELGLESVKPEVMDAYEHRDFDPRTSQWFSHNLLWLPAQTAVEPSGALVIPSWRQEKDPEERFAAVPDSDQALMKAKVHAYLSRHMPGFSVSQEVSVRAF